MISEKSIDLVYLKDPLKGVPPDNDIDTMHSASQSRIFVPPKRVFFGNICKNVQHFNHCAPTVDPVATGELLNIAGNMLNKSPVKIYQF